MKTKKFHLAIFIIIAIVFPLLFLTSSLFGARPTISDVVLSITCIIISWYTYETAQMKEEMGKQRKLSLSPFLIIEEDGSKLFLKNYGTPAKNIEISSVKIGEYETISFPNIVFLSANNSFVLSFHPEKGSDWIKDHLSVYWRGSYGSKFEIEVTIKYDDLLGHRFETNMKVGKGNHQIMSMKEIS